MRVGLVACAKRKRAEPAPAGLLYVSPLFRKAAAYCAATYDAWYILSARHGLVAPETMLAPYDEALARLDDETRRRWAWTVRLQIERAGLGADPHLAFHAGRRYREHIEDHYPSSAPLAGLGIGRQLRWYAQRGY